MGSWLVRKPEHFMKPACRHCHIIWDLGMPLLGAIPKKNLGELYVPLHQSTKLQKTAALPLNGCPAPRDAHLTEGTPQKCGLLLAAVLPWEKLLGNAESSEEGITGIIFPVTT